MQQLNLSFSKQLVFLLEVLGFWQALLVLVIIDHFLLVVNLVLVMLVFSK